MNPSTDVLVETEYDPSEAVVVDDQMAAFLNWKPYRKTTTTEIVGPIPFPFKVKTMEGVMAGKPGDYLARGPKGERYPIDAEVFAMTYEPVE